MYQSPAALEGGSYTTTIYGYIRDQQYEDALKILTFQLQNHPTSRAALSLSGKQKCSCI